MTRKPRGDSKLKTLPEERQKSILEYAARHTLKETLEWLRADGVETSQAALSQFLSWYPTRTEPVSEQEKRLGEFRKRPRGDSKLKRLSEEQQAAIAEYGMQHTLLETLQWLRADGTETSRSALSEFLVWYSMKERWREDGRTTDALLEQLKQEVPTLTDQQIDEFGQRTFSLLALRRQDADEFLSVRSAVSKAKFEQAKLAIRQQAEARLAQKSRFEREKWEVMCCEKVLKAINDARAKEIADAGFDNSEKIRLLRKYMFNDVDELDASGGVKLPPQ